MVSCTSKLISDFAARVLNELEDKVIYSELKIKLFSYKSINLLLVKLISEIAVILREFGDNPFNEQWSMEAVFVTMVILLLGNVVTWNMKNKN